MIQRLSKVKFAFYTIGILILTFGIMLTIQSHLGVSPFDALLVGLSKKIGLTVGSWEIIIAIILVFCNALLKRQRPEFLGLVTAFITGLGIDLWLFLLSNVITPEQWVSRLICFAIGLVVLGLGTAIYLQTKFAPSPIDHLTLIIKDLTKSNMFVARTIIYFLFLLLAFLFNGPIGIGTVLSVCFGGLILNFFMPMTKKALDFVLSNSINQEKLVSGKSRPL